MMLSLLAATFTFTATATGVGKGTPVEFMFVGPGSDRDYEAMFVLDQSVDEFCKGLEKAGIPRGKPVDVATCNLWPVGVPLTLKPAMSDFVETKMPAECPLGEIIYTGGTRLKDGSCDANTNMPLSVFSTYTLAQSPLVFDGIYDQGNVYNCHLAKAVEKGTKVTFSLSWDEQAKTTPLSVTFTPDHITEVFQSLKEASTNGPIEVSVDFTPELTVKEAITIAKGLSVLDSTAVKINGCPQGRFFYRAFLPLEKWREPQERLVQPFEFEVAENSTLWEIDEDWSVEGTDPKLTPKIITVAEAVKYPNTDTCFIYASETEKLSALYQVQATLKGTSVKTWYVFTGHPKRSAE